MPLSPPVQDTYAVSQILTAASMNKNVRDSVTFLANVPICKVYQATPQSIPNATNTAITFDTNIVDTYGGHSTTTNNTRYTAQVAGWYLIIGQGSFVFNATGVRSISFRINGGSSDSLSIVRDMAVTVTDPTTIKTLTQEFLNVGDYIEVVAFQRSGGALNLSGSESSLEVIWIHE